MNKKLLVFLLAAFALNAKAGKLSLSELTTGIVKLIAQYQ